MLFFQIQPLMIMFPWKLLWNQLPHPLGNYRRIGKQPFPFHMARSLSLGSSNLCTSGSQKHPLSWFYLHDNFFNYINIFFKLFFFEILYTRTHLEPISSLKKKIQTRPKPVYIYPNPTLLGAGWDPQPNPI